MTNLMAKDMTRRFDEFLHAKDLINKETNCIYHWVMSTIESLFWSYRLSAFQINMYASPQKIYLIFNESTDIEQEFVHYPVYLFENELFISILQSFIDIFNSVEPPVSDMISAPLFYAYTSTTCQFQNNKKDLRGYYHVIIDVDMLPD